MYSRDWSYFPGPVCTGDDCGCTRNEECPSGECQDGVCKYEAGKVLLKSITLNISDCIGCSRGDGGVYLTLLGEPLATGFVHLNHLGEPINTRKQGIPCNTSKLDYPTAKDFRLNKTPLYDGKEDKKAKSMLGKCYEVSLGYIEYSAIYDI